MKLFVLLSILVSLNCFYFGNIKRANISERIYFSKNYTSGRITTNKTFIGNISKIPQKKCFNILEGKLVRVACKFEFKTPRNLFLKGKPVIYLYPEKSMDISVQLKLKDSVFTAVYPKFTEKDTWNVHAEPDGTISIKDKKYPYLFWEALSYGLPDSNEGFVVTDKDAESFLEEKLDILGLNDKEKTDFITFWLPILLKNKLSLCTFQTQKFFDTMELNVTPKPDSMIRIFLSIIKLDKPINVKEQKLESVERKGFTVVEWGGSKL